MIRDIVITDLTRFNTGDRVCIAGFDPEQRRIIRPMPYLTQNDVRANNILPGTILRSDFSPVPNPEPPHLEDHFWSGLRNLGNVTSEDYLTLLSDTNVRSLQSGFGVLINHNQKHIDASQAANIQRSIITLEIPPNHLELSVDQYDRTKIKVHIQDINGFGMRYLSLTDLGYFLHFQGRGLAEALIEENEFIHGQERLFVRLGLGRIHNVQAANGQTRNGFWVQVNGIYTFPEYNVELRSY